MWVLQNLKLADKPFELFNVLKSWWWCYAVRVEKWIKWHVCHRYQEMWGQCLSYRGLHEVVKYPLEAHRSLVLVLFIPLCPSSWRVCTKFSLSDFVIRLLEVILLWKIEKMRIEISKKNICFCTKNFDK